jgi:hypothetical protein
MQPVTSCRSSHWTNAALLCFAAMLGANQVACFATTAKIRVGPTVDTDGNTAVQADLAFGFGYAISTKSGVTGSLGVGTGSSNHLELTDTIEYHQLEKDYGWRAGIRGDVGLVGDDKISAGWIIGAFLMPLKHRRSHTSGHGKGGFLDSGTSTSRWSLGIEGRFGFLTHEVGEDAYENAGAFGGAATLEWHGFSRTRL